MATLSITAGGGEVNDLTAAPGSSYACDVCCATDELVEWTNGRTGSVYHYCKVCWFDIQDSYDEIQYNRCATCSDGEATHRYLQEDGTYLEVCEGCFLLSGDDEEGGCDECGSETDLTEDYQTENGTVRKLCENCRPEFLEPLPKRQALQCMDCKKKPANKVFVHLDGRKFNLCEYCWSLADHEDDYGVEFGSVPNLRVRGPSSLCSCPVPCDFHSPTRCELCRGIVVVS